MRDHNGVLDGGYKMDSCSQQNVGDVKCGREGESSRKKMIIDGPPQVMVERRQRRMLKNRESAARSRARRQVLLSLTSQIASFDCINLHIYKQASVGVVVVSR